MNSDEVLRFALKKGASEAEVYVQDGTAIQVQFMGDDKEIKTVNSTGIGIRVAVGKRLGQYSTSILDEKNVRNAVDRAILIAKASPIDDDWNSFNRSFGASASSRLLDRDISHLGPIELVSLVDEAITVVKEYDPRVRPSTGVVSASTASISINNTNAREISQTSTIISGYFYSKAQDGDKTSTGSEFAQSRSLDEFDFRNAAFESAQRAVRSLNARSMKSKEIPVVIKNKVFASILGVMLSTPINADMVQKGASILADKMGEVIASDIVNVTDDGRMPGGLASSRFDDEGHSTQVTTIIKDGVLKNYIYDNYTALKDGIDSTGNGARAGYGSPVKPSISNLILSKSDVDHDELVIDIKHGLYVESVIGEWLSNAISGEVNATVTHGYLIENGELTQPIKGVIIAGNFYEILLNGLELIGNDLQNSGGMYSPSVKIAKLSVAGIN